MTKIIYVNWETHEIVSNSKEKEQWVDEWISDNAFSYSFDEWLETYYEAGEIYYMTAEEKAKLPMSYDKYLENEREAYVRKAEKVFNEEFEAIGIEVNGYVD